MTLRDVHKLHMIGFTSSDKERLLGVYTSILTRKYRNFKYWNKRDENSSSLGSKLASPL